MRHFAKLFSCPATMFRSSLFLSSLNGETVRRSGDKRYYFEEPNKSLTLRERGLLTLAGMGLPPGSRTVEKHQHGCEKLESVQWERTVRRNLSSNIKQPVQKEGEGQ